jgi:site-specific DNA-methyltransferase (adenine-specific)
MARYPDNYFDLAIVDPPYGIDMDNQVELSQMNTYSKSRTKAI